MLVSLNYAEIIVLAMQKMSCYSSTLRLLFKKNST